jgi:hypothetical protein
MAHIKHHENLYNASNLHWFIVLYTVQECCKYYVHSTQRLHQNCPQKINYPSFPQYVTPVLSITAQYRQVGQMKTEPTHRTLIGYISSYNMCKVWFNLPSVTVDGYGLQLAVLFDIRQIDY